MSSDLSRHPDVLRVLRSVRDHGDPWNHARTQSEHGGLTQTIPLLERCGLIYFVSEGIDPDTAVARPAYWLLTTHGRKSLEEGRFCEV